MKVPVIEWIYPEDTGLEPNAGENVLVLTDGGMPILSSWVSAKERGFVAWVPLPIGKKKTEKK